MAAVKTGDGERGRVQVESMADGPADPDVALDLDTHSNDTPADLRTSTNGGERPQGRNFSHFAFYGAKQGSNQQGSEKPKPAPMSNEGFASLVHTGKRGHERLGSLKGNSSFGALRLKRDISGLTGISKLQDFSPSPSVYKRRRKDQVIEDDDDDSPGKDMPLSQRVTSKPVMPPHKLRRTHRIEGLEEDDVPDSKAEDSDESVEVLPQHNTMRIRREQKRDYGPKMVDLNEVGEVLEENAVDEVLQQCEDISNKLKKALSSSGTNKYEALQGGTGMATPELLVKACGEAARFIKSYQLVGINFLLLLVREGVEGSILADEMGLGKTAQVICFLGCIRELYKDEGPHLIIVPPSLLENWQRELQRWCPSLKAVAYYGSDRGHTRRHLDAFRRGKAANAANAATATAASGATLNGASDQAEQSQAQPEVVSIDSDEEEEFLEDSEGEGSQHEEVSSEDSDFEEEAGGNAERKKSHSKASTRGVSAEAPFHILLTCYNLFERDSEEQRADRAFLSKWRWSHMILDEAHAVKNAKVQRTSRLNKLAGGCRRRIMMTGTPLQNDLEELQNLLCFLMPKVFTQEEAEEIQNVKEEEEVAKLAERMQGLLRPFVLRRLKTEVANQLVPKKHKLLRIEMTAAQAEAYAQAVAALRKDISAPDKGKAEDSSKLKTEAAKLVQKMGQRRLGNAFVSLRKIAMHPLLVRRIVTDQKLEEFASLCLKRGVFKGTDSHSKVLAELKTYSDFQLHSLAQSHGSSFSRFVLTEEHLYSSAKCRLLAQFLPALKAAGSRPLIFSQWTMVLDILEWLLLSLNLPFVRLDGNTAVADRLTYVDMFNNDKAGIFAFLLSSRAGGQGLNLTGADTVILHDVDFNPQIDRQAEDRCHRLGQSKPVTVIRMVTEETVDAGIHALAEKKLRLDAAVLDGITASAKQTKAAENAAMSDILQSLLTGNAVEKSSDEDTKANPYSTVEHLKDLPDPSKHKRAAPGGDSGTTTTGGAGSDIIDVLSQSPRRDSKSAEDTVMGVPDTPDSDKSKKSVQKKD